LQAPRALRLYGALVVALRQTPGDIAEFGVATGETAREMIAYLEAAGPAVMASVGAYQLERYGVHLFERVEADHFTILGLPLLPALDFLRQEGSLVG